MTVTIYEYQIGVEHPEEWPLIDGTFRGRIAGYQYLGPYQGLYAFVDNDGSGSAELFQRSNQPHAHWHLRRGSYFYEFCCSMPN